MSTAASTKKNAQHHTVPGETLGSREVKPAHLRVQGGRHGASGRGAAKAGPRRLLGEFGPVHGPVSRAHFSSSDTRQPEAGGGDLDGHDALDWELTPTCQTLVEVLLIHVDRSGKELAIGGAEGDHGQRC